MFATKTEHCFEGRVPLKSHTVCCFIKNACGKELELNILGRCK